MKKRIFIIALIVILVLVIGIFINSNKENTITDNIDTLNTSSKEFGIEIIGNDSYKSGDEIELIIKIKDTSLIGGSANGICAVVGKLTYDEEKLEKINGEGLNSFGILWGNNVVIDSVEGVNIDTEIAIIRFKIKDTADSGETVISLSNVTGSNGDKDIKSNDFDKKIEITK